MSKLVDILTVDCTAMDSHILKYVKENGKLPYGLLVDSITVWDLVLHISNSGTSLGQRMIIDGVSVFEKELWLDLHVGVLDFSRGRRADLVDEETFKDKYTDQELKRTIENE